MTNQDTSFTGSVPGLYDRYLGPLLFEPFAAELARRVAPFSPRRILEVAAGTGIATMALNRALPDAEIVATDLNQAMLDVAAERIAAPNVAFHVADALNLPFEDSSFDLVVSQFGVMFYPDRVKGNSEARRMLATGGRYVAVIWDRLDRNPVSEAVSAAAGALFPNDPPRFLERTPFGYSDLSEIRADLEAAGFTDIEIDTVVLHSVVDPAGAAHGLILGSPFRAEVEERDPSMLTAVEDAAAQALRKWEGQSLPMSAHFASATRQE